MEILQTFLTPGAWLAFLTLVLLETVLARQPTLSS
jgi:predicted tellurium resistance membrane protein TerC